MDIDDLVGRLGPWASGPGPLYRRLAGGLRRMLEAGHVAEGVSLPPERRLAAALAVSRNTVTAAYAELRSEGWLDSRQGSSTRVAGLVRHSPVAAHRANGLFATLLRTHPDVVDLTVAVPDAAPVVTEVLADPARHLDDPADLTAGHGYHPLGHPRLREALARVLTANGLASTAEQVLVTSGAQQAISLAVSATIRAGDPVAIEEVSFPGAIDVIGQRGGRLVPIPTGEHGVDLDAFQRTLGRDRPRLAYGIPTFHNPTGAVVEGGRRRRLAGLVGDSGITFVDDMTLAELDFDRPAPPPLAAVAPTAPIISLGGMSKVFWGGLRIGWIRAAPALIDHLAGLKATADLGNSAAPQLLAAVMLDRYEETRRWRNHRLRCSLDAAAEALDRHAPEWEWTPPPGGPHLWIRLPGTDATAFSHLLLRHGVAVVAGPLLATGEGAATDRIRLPLYPPPEVLAGAIRSMAEVWRSRARRP